jgi:ferritin
MTAYFESLSLKGFSHWMSLQAQEELLHVSKLFQHINDRAGRVVFNAIEAPPSVWDSPLKVMEAAYAHECTVSESINEEVGFALSLNDHTSVTFLQWFVAEQVEEEAVADEIVQKLKIIGDNSSALFLLDHELGQRPAVSLDAEAGGA